MKPTLGLCVKDRGGGEEPSNKRGLQYLCFYIYVYVCTGQIYPFIYFFFFKTHSTKRKGGGATDKQKEPDDTNLIHSFILV